MSDREAKDGIAQHPRTGVSACDRQLRGPTGQPGVPSMSLTAKIGLPATPRPNHQPRARSSATLHEMAQFPRRAHWAWRGLPLAQQFQVLALMSMTHGKAFANAFVG
jgi:hypothetical protein